MLSSLSRRQKKKPSKHEISLQHINLSLENIFQGKNFWKVTEVLQRNPRLINENKEKWVN